jgi:hypothetical protein
VICPDKVHEHQRRFDCPAFGYRDNDNVTLPDPLAEFFRGCLYAEREPVLCFSGKQEGVSSLNEQKLVPEGILHAAAISSDWQQGQMGFFPMPLNRSPHSLHR